MASAATEITTVPATGQVMTATFTGLQYDTEYTYRAFVKTSAGFVYDDEISFTTPNLDGITITEAEAEPVSIIGYFDLMGRKYNEPVRGINIVVYSNGTAKKIVK